MTTATTKAAREPAQIKAVPHPTPAERGRRFGHDLGMLALNAYERRVADIVAFEKDAAKIAPYPWMKEAFTVSAGPVEDVGAAYAKTARQILR